MTQLVDLLRSIDPDDPWVRLDGDVTAAATEADAAGIVVRVVRGSRCRDTGDLFEEFAVSLGFPDYFGRNFDALDECLSDLPGIDVLNGIALVILDVHLVLEREPLRRPTFASILRSASRGWMSPDGLSEPRRRPVPFHVVLADPARDATPLEAPAWLHPGDIRRGFVS